MLRKVAVVLSITLGFGILSSINAAQKKEIFVKQSAYRKRLIATLRRFQVFSRTTPELDNLDLWLAGFGLGFYF